jgi:hypothetical protein
MHHVMAIPALVVTCYSPGTGHILVAGKKGEGNFRANYRSGCATGPCPPCCGITNCMKCGLKESSTLPWHECITLYRFGHALKTGRNLVVIHANRCPLATSLMAVRSSQKSPDMI